MDENLNEVGWYCGNSGGLHLGGLKQSNVWDLYDMHGNADEWCWNIYYSHIENLPSVDPVNVSGDVRVRVVRGFRVVRWAP
jgi:formylglycine-generating enzyme required for sulfatase activity